jgi:post-segregation antitoxin (ccd killing protein)
MDLARFPQYHAILSRTIPSLCLEPAHGPGDALEGSIVEAVRAMPIARLLTEGLVKVRADGLEKDADLEIVRQVLVTVDRAVRAPAEAHWPEERRPALAEEERDTRRQGEREARVASSPPGAATRPAEPAGNGRAMPRRKGGA